MHCSRDLNQLVTLYPEAGLDLRWWVNVFRQFNGKAILPSCPDLSNFYSTTECSGSERLLTELVQPSRCISSLRLNLVVPGQDQERESRSGVNMPIMAFSALAAAAI